MNGSIDWIAFLAAMAVVELTPGPNMGWLTAVSAQKGRRVGFTAVLGITLGLSVQLIAAAAGFSTFVAGNEVVYQTLRWGGVAFMLYLAWTAFAETGDSSPGHEAQAEGFRRGFIANLLNPKALVFYIAVVGQFATSESWPVWAQILVLGSLHILLSVLVHAGLVLLGAQLGEQIERWRRLLAVRLAFAGALVAIAAWIAFSTR
ncbi:MAG: LysE family translocator [Henriciella sp.]|uniref:LysE family translocator n=1 Tax=Henriciella sp. TaxID=1968823 RepID=UPI002626619D|nr:LysE family translocator [Henriciella sp.]